MAEPLHILILEDNPADAELVQFELSEAGLEFISKIVADKKDYVRELREFSPDLILSDYDLPQFNGILALAEARRIRPDTPFILVTGAVSEDRAIEILTQGAKDYVLKTRLQQRLGPAVKRALAEAKEFLARRKAEADLREAHKNLERQVDERTAELQRQMEHGRNIEKALLKYNERLEILSYISSRLLASDKPQQIVEELCSRVMQFLDCQAFFNFLVDESSGRLHLNACAGIPPETAEEIEWLDLGVAVCGCVAKEGARIIAENIPETPDVRTELIKSFGIKAYACHPLLEQSRVIGTLSFGTRTRTTFSTDDLAMMKAVADQVAVAMSRVRMENALRESEFRERARAAEMQAVMDMAPAAVWIAHDPQCLKITGNRYADEIMRVSQGSDTSAGADPGKKAVTHKVIQNGRELKPEELPAQRAASTGLPVEAELFDLVFSDGREVRMVEGAVPLFDAAGRIRGSVAAGIDVTRLRQVEEELRQISWRFEMAQYAAQVGTWDWDVLTGEILWSDQMFHLFRLDPQKIPASFESWKSVLHPEDTETAMIRIDEALRQKTTLNSNYRIVLPDGQIRWINSIGEGKYDSEGRPIRMIGICMDITEQKQTDESLREAHARTTAILESIADAFFSLDNAWRFVEVNPAAERAPLGKPARELLGRVIWDVFPVLVGTDIHRHYLDAMIKGSREHYEALSPVNERWYEVFIFPRATGLDVYLRDIDGRKKTEEELRRKSMHLETVNRELESFSYSVSHDLRAPLRIIDGYARKLERDYADRLDDKFNDTVRVIRNSTKLAGSLIEDLLSLSKVQKTAMYFSEIDMDHLVREVWNEIQEAHKGRKLNLAMSNIIPGYGDRSLIRQVLFNLLENAVKFTKNRTPDLIEMESFVDSGHTVYCIKDNGAGFDMDYYNKLFGVFQRLHSSDEYEGTGVGLAIVQRIINRHGGRVWAEGEVDRGAAFYFTLPGKA